MWTEEQYIAMDKRASEAMRAAGYVDARQVELERKREEFKRTHLDALREAAKKDRKAKQDKMRLEGKVFKTQLERIIAEVSVKHEVPVEILKSECQTSPVVKARWEAFHRIREELKLSKAAIGRIFNRDHTTVMHGLKQYRSES